MASDMADDPELPLRAMALRAGVAMLALGVGSRQPDSTTDPIGGCQRRACAWAWHRSEGHTSAGPRRARAAARKLLNLRRMVFSNGFMSAACHAGVVGGVPYSWINLRIAVSASTFRRLAVDDFQLGGRPPAGAQALRIVGAGFPGVLVALSPWPFRRLASICVNNGINGPFRLARPRSGCVLHGRLLGLRYGTAGPRQNSMAIGTSCASGAWVRNKAGARCRGSQS
jgi:hypothetical protein